MIEDYHFGSITIEGKTYDHDVEVRWKGKVLKWWRKRGHLFSLEDLDRALKEDPQILVLGTGAYGAAKVEEEVQKEMEKRNIELVVKETQPAVKKFNQLLNQKKEVIGLFHLTC